MSNARRRVIPWQNFRFHNDVRIWWFAHDRKFTFSFIIICTLTIKYLMYSQIFAFFVNLLFLGQAFTIMLVYVWSRRNPYIRMNFFGILNFLAPYLPWALLGFSIILGNTIWVDLMGMACGKYRGPRWSLRKKSLLKLENSLINLDNFASGHIYFFLEYIFPKQRGGFRILKTPLFL